MNIEEYTLKIEKDKAIKMRLLTSISWWILGSIIWTMVVSPFKIMFTREFIMNFFDIQIFIYALIIMATYETIKFWYESEKIKSLEYTINPEEHKLIGNWKVITRHKDTARLQVVNDVNINQGLIERIFNLFNVKVRYGFSDEGYYFYFKYLSEEEAEKILKIIKSPKGIFRTEIK